MLAYRGGLGALLLGVGRISASGFLRRIRWGGCQWCLREGGKEGGNNYVLSSNDEGRGVSAILMARLLYVYCQRVGRHTSDEVMQFSGNGGSGHAEGNNVIHRGVIKR